MSIAQCTLFSVVFIPPPSSHHGVFGCLGPICHLSSLANAGMPTYVYHWKGFVGAKRKTSVGLLVFNPLWYSLCSVLYYVQKYKIIENTQYIIENYEICAGV
jgi:hypothetical protein